VLQLELYVRIADSCLLLLQAIPILNDALAALDTIKEADIAYIKKLQNPPSAIKLVLEAVCVVLDVKPVKVRTVKITVVPHY
jgi:dynein heavy chain